MTSLFVFNNYLQGVPQTDRFSSTLWHNLINTYLQAGYTDWKYLDTITNGAKLYDNILKEDFDYLLFCCEGLHPSQDFIEDLYKKGKRIALLWFDSAYGNAMHEHKRCCVNLCYDVGRGNYKDNIVGIWMAQDQNLYYYDPNLVKDIDASFIGEFRESRGRHDVIRAIRNGGIDILSKGGRGGNNDNLTHEEYAELYRRSKISLNLSDGLHTKGKIFESTQCNNLLVTDGKPFVEQYFEPDKECVVFNDGNEAAEKIKYYLDNEVARLSIANAGHRRMISEYSPKNSWDLAFKYIKKF